MIANSHEELLKYYQSELTYLRRMGGVFAERYPRVAKRLELGRDECADPHVERLIEAFAFLTGRLQHEIDSEFPDITSALLNILYPQLTSPIPSMAIAQFNIAPDQGQLTSGFTIDRHTSLFADAANGVFCRFRTSYPVTLWPLTSGRRRARKHAALELHRCRQPRGRSVASETRMPAWRQDSTSCPSIVCASI